jgi:hypothetical protein
MEEASKDQLKSLQDFFKQRNKQNEGLNNEVIDHVGKLLSEIDASKLKEADKITNNKMVNALGNFIAASKQKWVVKSQALNGKDFTLEQPKATISILDLEDFTDSATLKKEVEIAATKNSHLILLASEHLQIDISEFDSPNCKIWLFDNENGNVQTA